MAGQNEKSANGRTPDDHEEHMAKALEGKIPRASQKDDDGDDSDSDSDSDSDNDSDNDSDAEAADEDETEAVAVNENNKGEDEKEAAADNEQQKDEVGVEDDGTKRVAVFCKQLKGELVCEPTINGKYAMHILCDGESMTPSDFEIKAGAGSSKKWRASCKVLVDDEDVPVGEWLVQQGIEQGKDKVDAKVKDTVKGGQASLMTGKVKVVMRKTTGGKAPKKVPVAQLPKRKHESPRGPVDTDAKKRKAADEPPPASSLTPPQVNKRTPFVPTPASHFVYAVDDLNARKLHIARLMTEMAPAVPMWLMRLLLCGSPPLLEARAPNTSASGILKMFKDGNYCLVMALADPRGVTQTVYSYDEETDDMGVWRNEAGELVVPVRASLLDMFFWAEGCQVLQVAMYRSDGKVTSPGEWGFAKLRDLDSDIEGAIVDARNK